MTLYKNQMEKFLDKNDQIPDKVNQRISETYDMLLADAKKQGKHGKHGYRKNSYAAAVAAIICCLAIPGVVYAAANSDFFQEMFGNTMRESVPSETREIDNGKGGKTPVTFPAHEYVSVDPEEAEELTGGSAMSEPVERQLGEHTLRIENLIYDKNSAFMSFTLEREGGVTMLVGDETTNEAKGAYFNDDDLWAFNLETTKGTPYARNIYIDTKKSTEDKFYCYAYMISFKSLQEDELPVLKIYQYPGPRSELPEDSELDEEITVPLTEKKAIPVQRIDIGENGYIEYSPVSISIDLGAHSLTEEEAANYHLEIKYKDGSSYVIYDAKSHTDNSSYSLGVENMNKTAFNRLVNTENIEEIILNDLVFPVG